MAPDLPIEDDQATLSDHAAVVLDAIGTMGGEGELVVVGQSYGGYVAPIVAERVAADLLVLVAAMIPQPGESADEMWEATGWDMPPGDTIAVFYHDVDPALAAAAMSHERRQSSSTSGEPWPLTAWPDVPTRFILCRDDRFFKPAGCARSCATGWAGSRISSTAAIRRRSAIPSSSSTCWNHSAGQGGTRC